MGRRAAAPRRLALLFVSAAAALAAPATAHGADRIYWSNFNSGNPARTIAYRNLDGSGGLNLSTAGATVDGAMGMALDPSHGRVYWTNWGADTGMGHGHGTTISYANLDGSGSGGDLPIAAAFVVGPHGLAIDPVAGKIYWPNFGDDDGVHETGEDTIASANLDGSGAAYVNTAGTSISGPRGVTLDPAAGRIYWANYGDGLGTTISYANLDGSGGADVVTMPGTATTEGPEGIALDVAAGRIYWGNYGPQPPVPGKGDTIAYTNLDGTGDSADLDTSPIVPDRVHGVAIDPAEGAIYWPNYGANTLAKANLDGSGGTQIVADAPEAKVFGPVLPTLLNRPLGTGTPSIGGNAAIGSTLSCGQGSWAPDLVTALLYRAPQSVSYEWTRDGQNVVGATSNSVAATAPGTYRCRVTAHNAAGATSQLSDPLTIPAAVGPPTPPSNSFTIGMLKRNTHNGTARLAVSVPGPGTVALTETNKLKAVSKTAPAGEALRLPIEPRGKTSKTLLRRGKVKLHPTITYTPAGGTANAVQTAITLKEKVRG